MALDEIRNIPLLLLYYFNIILTYGLEDVIVDYNDILQIMAWMPFWLSKIFFSSYKSFLLLVIFGELYYLLNQIHKILQYVAITVAPSVLIYNAISILIYNESWIAAWVLEIINSILNIWTVSAFIVGLGFFGIADSREMNYGGVNKIIMQSSIMAIFLYPLILFTKMFQYTFVDFDIEEEPAPAA